MTQHLMNLEFLEFFLHNYRPQTKFMFLQVAVILFTGGGVHGAGGVHGWGCAWQKGMRGGGVWMAGDMCGVWGSMSRQYASYSNAFLLF